VFPKRADEDWDDVVADSDVAVMVSVSVFVTEFMSVVVDVKVIQTPDSYTVVEARTIVSATKRPRSADLSSNLPGTESARKNL
jgi:hypothetical protein